METVTYTVGELATAVARALARAFPEEIWVQGEIRDLSRASSGHVYFTLIEAEEGEVAPAALPVTLFESDKMAVNRVLARSGAVRMTDGVDVRIRGRVGHYAARGTVQLRMTWIDTDFTLGKLAAERDRLIKSLTKRGLVDANSARPVPLVPLRVGLITSQGSAASADFLDELSRSGYAWQVRLFDARVQGVDAAPDLVRGIRSLARKSVDVIALVRGGGAQTDLAAFDREDVAVAIAECPIPILTGIGHETDVSVADLVARNFKTPTACAAGLVDRVTDYVRRVDEVGVATKRAVFARLAVASGSLDHSAKRIARSAIGAGFREEQRLADAARRIARGSRSRLSRDRRVVVGLRGRIERASLRQAAISAGGLDSIAERLGHSARRASSLARGHLDEIEHRLALLDPARILARGWSITRDQEGSLVVHPDDAGPGSRLFTTVAGGQIVSVVDDEQEVGRG